jgi:DNA-binding HxlR family transcriptional regulator
MDRIDRSYQRLLRVIGGPWNSRIVATLSEGGEMRFNELYSTLGGISPKTLTARLVTLGEFGFVERTDFGGMPPKVVYRLTDRGVQLAALLSGLGDWADVYVPSGGEVS